MQSSSGSTDLRPASFISKNAVEPDWKIFRMRSLSVPLCRQTGAGDRQRVVRGHNVSGAASGGGSPGIYPRKFFCNHGWSQDDVFVAAETSKAAAKQVRMMLAHFLCPGGRKNISCSLRCNTARYGSFILFFPSYLFESDSRFTIISCFPARSLTRC